MPSPEDLDPPRLAAVREVNGVPLPRDARVLEEGESVAGPYVLWYLPFSPGWGGEPAVMVFASTPSETGKGVILKRSVLEALREACA